MSGGPEQPGDPGDQDRPYHSPGGKHMRRMAEGPLTLPALCDSFSPRERAGVREFIRTPIE
ncbi:hypothetical protein GCM10008937_02140 [Deinococcus depolymerans]|uniref:Uncharacterized protein n=1 Tax=Deinococcus depolymerans TaxID=392408 RepID=A0ABN1BIU9_9DEIO